MPRAIAIVLEGMNELPEAHDEGRVTEPLLIGARLLGLGVGTAWFGDGGSSRKESESLESRPRRLRAQWR